MIVMYIKNMESKNSNETPVKTNKASIFNFEKKAFHME